MKVEGLCGGIMRGSGRGRRLNLDFPSSFSSGSVSSSWIEDSLMIRSKLDSSICLKCFIISSVIIL